MTPTIMGWAARLIMVAWAAWWTFFALANVATDRVFSIIPWMLIAVLWSTVALAWTMPVAGGLALIAEGCFVIACYLTGWLSPNGPGMSFVIATLAAPPILAGLLLLAGGGRRLASA